LKQNKLHKTAHRVYTKEILFNCSHIQILIHDSIVILKI